MSRIYDNWERLVEATLKRQHDRELAYCESLSSGDSEVSSDSFREDVAGKGSVSAPCKQTDFTFHSPLQDELAPLVFSNEWDVDDLVEKEGTPEALLKLIKEPISLATTKTSLSAIFQLVVSSATFSNKNAAAYFAEIGIVLVLTEMLVASEKSICEKALGILEGICSCSEGIEKACENALTVPIVVKKLLRISDLATQFSVSILWKLGKNENRGRGVILEAWELGTFQKLLLLLQVGCEETTKKNTTELLKMLNQCDPRKSSPQLNFCGQFCSISNFL